MSASSPWTMSTLRAKIRKEIASHPEGLSLGQLATILQEDPKTVFSEVRSMMSDHQVRVQVPRAGQSFTSAVVRGW